MTDFIARLERACARAEEEFPKLAAPDGTVAVPFTDLRALLSITERKAPVEVEGLVESLRLRAGWTDEFDPVMCFVLDEAADALQSQATELATLKQQLAEREEALRPEWFYLGDDQSSDQCRFSVYEVIDEDFEASINQRPGEHVVHITTALRGADIWALVKYFTEEEKDARESDDPYEITEFASEAGARQALTDKGPEQKDGEG